MRSAYLLDAVRTPVGKLGGALAGARPDDLAAVTLQELARRTAIDPGQLDDVVLGNANGAGEENRDVARMAALLAGFPTSVPGTTVNRLCGSGLEAAIQAARAIETGDASLVIAGGVESMSRAPWVLPKPDRAYPHGGLQAESTSLGWRFINPRMPKEWTVSLGEATEQLAAKYGVTREAQDLFALASHEKAAKAWAAGAFDDEVLRWDRLTGILPTKHTPLTRDESIRDGSTPELMAKLKPAFRADGTVTAGNASTLNDGASAVLIADESTAQRLGNPLARIVSRAVHGVEPQYFGIGPVEASNKALAKAGIGWNDLTLVELNEAYAAQSLACLGQWPELDPAKVNVNGGAIALGHPLGSSGTRILTTLAHELKRRGGGYGLATLCIGVGQGLAMVIEA
ncbi:thiolase family protein [Kribbella sandramycini]|uniref:Probable acetyl-CoA acetyltransferase n=1 Tax=Kribbella sandramycini TaxID=60450 RepID=A0A7Y4KZC6_9ACTN|nr:thiolase family protein [Kribbella sandramycini]MBB6565189.1 acetyl-CoA acyltransferase [Kribbella sandramycini]NOL41458.1 thiolase family protein [Kribbella sandramycini]